MNWLNRLGALCVCWPSSKCLVVWCKCKGGMQGSEGRCRNMSRWLGKISTISTWGASASADASEHRHVRAKHSKTPFSTYLNAWAAAATPRSVPSSSFGRRQRAASFLSSLVMMMAIMMNSEDFLSRGNFPREISFSEKSRLGSLLPRTLGQSLSSASRPEIKDWRSFLFCIAASPWRRWLGPLCLSRWWGEPAPPPKTVVEPVAGEEEELLGCFYPLSSYSTQNFPHFVFVVEFPLQDLFSSEILQRVLEKNRNYGD